MPESKFDEVRYYFRQFHVYNELRDSFLVLMENYGRRVGRQLHTAATPAGQPGGAGGEASRPPASSRSLTAGLRKAWQFLRLLPAFFSQARRMRAATAGAAAADVLVLALASNRLFGAQMRADPREYFAKLLESFSARDPGPRPAEEVRRAGSVFVCEPLSNSPMWEIREKCWQQRVFILDASFLLFLAMGAVLSGRARCLWRGIADSGSFRRGAATPRSLPRALATVVPAMVFVDALRLAFARVVAPRAYLLTSNSFATETLRFYLLRRPDCQWVCEIMHGIPTSIYERYLAGMLRAAAAFGAAEKHSSISQLPRLPMFGVLVDDVKCGPDMAVNCYLNRYWIERETRAPSFVDFLGAEVTALIARLALDDDTLIVTFVGGMSAHQDCFESENFRVESHLLRRTRAVLLEMGRPFRIIYTPHPGYPLASFQQHPFFRELDIAIHPDTTLSWFISDICLSLFSSAVFEAAYFGAAGFTPTIAQDDVFPPVLLDMLAHPVDDQPGSCDATLETFIRGRADARAALNLLDRARDRARRLAPQRLAMGDAT